MYQIKRLDPAATVQNTNSGVYRHQTHRKCSDQRRDEGRAGQVLRRRHLEKEEVAAETSQR